LIELIFTMVIIAMVFTVIPRIVYVTNNSIDFSLKEEGIFNMMSQVMYVSTKEWDENNTKYNDILIVNNPPKYVLDCNASSHYRIGGFVGGRNCQNNISISTIGVDANENNRYEYDDIDDFNNTQTNATKIASRYHNRYTLFTAVNWANEWHKSDYDHTTQTLNYQFSNTASTAPTNIKMIKTTLLDQKTDKNISSQSYFSANIGHSFIEARQW